MGERLIRSKHSINNINDGDGDDDDDDIGSIQKIRTKWVKGNQAVDPGGGCHYQLLSFPCLSWCLWGIGLAENTVHVFYVTCFFLYNWGGGKR